MYFFLFYDACKCMWFYSMVFLHNCEELVFFGDFLPVFPFLAPIPLYLFPSNNKLLYSIVLEKPMRRQKLQPFRTMPFFVRYERRLSPFRSSSSLPWLQFQKTTEYPLTEFDFNICYDAKYFCALILWRNFWSCKFVDNSWKLIVKISYNRSINFIPHSWIFAVTVDILSTNHLQS